jgi:ABC-type antimicrobial peptide transport system permease subunit
MFLSEAVLIGIVGGAIGILTGYGLSFALSYGLSGFITQGTIYTTSEPPQRMAINPVFSPEWTIAALIFAIIVCIIFGLYPARKASKLNPVDALRYE